jgi:hypothetical protein
MNASMGYLRQYLNAWRDNAGSVRVFFPDNIVSSSSRQAVIEWCSGMSLQASSSSSSSSCLACGQQA